MTAITFVPNAAVLTVFLNLVAMSALIGLGRRWRPMLNIGTH